MARPIDLSKAALTSLTTIPKIGDQRASYIVELRRYGELTIPDLCVATGLTNADFEQLIADYVICNIPKQSRTQITASQFTDLGDKLGLLSGNARTAEQNAGTRHDELVSKFDELNTNAKSAVRNARTQSEELGAKFDRMTADANTHHEETLEQSKVTYTMLSEILEAMRREQRQLTQKQDEL